MDAISPPNSPRTGRPEPQIPAEPREGACRSDGNAASATQQVALEELAERVIAAGAQCRLSRRCPQAASCA